MDQPGVAKLGQDVVEELLRDRVALGDVGDLRQRARLEAREMDHGLQAVLALVCQHCSSSARTGPLARLCDALREGDGVGKVYKIDN